MILFQYMFLITYMNAVTFSHWMVVPVLLLHLNFCDNNFLGHLIQE